MTNEQAIDIITEYRDKLYDTIPCDMKEALDIAIKTLDLTKNRAYDKGFITAMKLYSRPQGEWLPNYTSQFMNPGKQCSLCGKIVEFSENYCPKCGAEMRGDKNEIHNNN